MLTFSSSAGRTASQPASLPAVSPGSDGCGASRITLNNSLLRPIYENRILKMIIPMRYGDSFVLRSIAFFSTH